MADDKTKTGKQDREKLRGTGGGKRTLTLQERGRLYQYLMRQGFTPAGIAAALRRMGAAPGDD